MSKGLSRRRLLLGGAAGAALAATGPRVAGPAAASPSAQPGLDLGGSPAAATVPCHGAHQAGVATAAQAHAAFVALTLVPGTDRDALWRLVQLWADDIERLTVGAPALADPVPELAELPARLTVTVGFGPGFFTAAGAQAARPAWLRPLPAFAGDALDPAHSGGDLLLQVCADDPMTVSHAVTVLTTSASGFAVPAWRQNGFQRAAGMTPPGTIGRNLMGFIDGIVNPAPGSTDFDEVVWGTGGVPSWQAGGTALVLRRIRMNLETWSALSAREREEVFGRRAADGAPLTGRLTTDRPDLDAKLPNGLSAIPAFAHVRLAAPAAPTERILRRPYNYDDGTLPDGTPDRGLIFAAYCADPERQFLPIAKRLADGDLLNTWTTAVGSAVFAIPAGFGPGGAPGQALLT